MFPESKLIINISGRIIENWHKKESAISSIEDALSLIKSNSESGILDQIEQLSIINTCLWHEEDKARDTGASDNTIAGVKRNIDKFNAMRVNKTEEIDSLLWNSISMNEKAPLNTETAGSVIDRLTIISLKKYHMALEADRKTSTEELKERCRIKLAGIKKQLNDLSEAYDNLVAELIAGKRRYALYSQFKMYNDPELNPVLYGKDASARK